MKLLSISVVIPTYNSEKVLPLCLESIRNQDYPEDKIEIIIADGGSTDRTLKIARDFDVDKILDNPLKTGEAGKAVGVKKAKNEIIAFIDSDNILPQKDWLQRMIEPFADEEIVGTEPFYYTYRKEDGYITRYCALLGMNDPLCLFLGNYDRYSILTEKWTEMPVEEEDNGNYLKVKLFEKALPTIGANGFLIRDSVLSKCKIGDYLFDIDLTYELVKNGKDKFGKVKVGIIHIFSGSVFTFIRKQRRRIKDFAYFKQLNLRKYPWSYLNKIKLLKFLLYGITVFPLLFQTIKGFINKKDKAWLFHVPACWITLGVYVLGSFQNVAGVRPEDRNKWTGT